MREEFRWVYDLCRRNRHGAAYALRIVIDYQRGDEHAKTWVEMLKRIEADRAAA